MKKYISLILVLLMTMTFVPLTGAADDFSDLFPTLDAGGSQGGSVSVEIDPDADLSHLPILESLGIIDETDSLPENIFKTVSRAKTVSHILKLKGFTEETISGNPLKGYFLDVTDETEYASEIEFAAELGIVSGFGDGTFRPTEQISYNEVLKLVIAALGYTAEAEGNGGYYIGYFLTAASLKLTKNAPQQDVNIFGTVTRILYNALNTKTLTGNYSANEVHFSKNDTTLINDAFDVKMYTGIVEAVGQSSIYGYSEEAVDQMTISGERFENGLENATEYIGKKVRFYTTKDETSIYDKVIGVEVMPVNVVTSFAIDEDVDPEDERIYYVGEDGKETYVKIDDRCNILYNGRGSAYDPEMVTPVSNNTNVPMEGDVTCIDNDGDGKVDLVVVNSYWTFFADSVISKQGMVADYYYTKFRPADKFYRFLKPGEDDSQVVYKNNKEISLAEIRSKNVICVQESVGGMEDTSTLYVVDSKVAGEITAIDEEGILTIGNKEYEISEYYKYMQRVSGGHAPRFQLGDTVEVYLDMFGKIAGCSARTGKKVGDYYFMFSYSGSRTRLELDVMDNNGNMKTVTVEDTVKYKARNTSEAVRTKAGDIRAEWDTEGYVSAPVKLKVDDENKVSYIEMVNLVPIPSAEVTNGNILMNDVSSQYLKEIGQNTISNADQLTVSGKTVKFGIGYGAPGAAWDETDKRAENYNLPVNEKYSYKMTANLATTTGGTNLLKAHVDMIYVADYQPSTNEIGMLVVDTLPNDEYHNAVFVNAEKTAAEMARKYPSIASFSVASNYANIKNGGDSLARYFGEWVRFDMRDTRVTQMLLVNKVINTVNDDGDRVQIIKGLNNGKEVTVEVRPDCIFWSTTSDANAQSWFEPVDLYDMEANAKLANRFYRDYNGARPEVLPGDVYAYIKKTDGSAQELYYVANMNEGPGVYGSDPEADPISRHFVSFGANMKWGFCFGAVHGITSDMLQLRDRSHCSTTGSFSYSVQNGVEIQEFKINNNALYMWDFQQKKFIVANRNEHLVPSYMTYRELPEATYSHGSKVGQSAPNNVWAIVCNQHWAQNIEMIFADYYDSERYYED